MRVGICILPDLPWAQSRPLWLRAEEMGFAHAWTYDHLVWGSLPDSRWFSCIPTLTAVAALTSRLRLGTFVVSPNFRHPVAFSREVQTLVDISDGRLLLGLGAGGTPDDTLLGGDRLPARERVDRLQEFTTLLAATLHEDHVSADGHYFQARNMRLVGGSIRDRVPLLLAGNGPRSVRFAARYGDGWITTGNPAGSVDGWLRGIRTSCSVLNETLAEEGRGTFPRYLSIDSAPGCTLASVAHFDDLVGRAGELGFTDVIVHWPRTEEPYRGSLAVLDALAARGFTVGD